MYSKKHKKWGKKSQKKSESVLQLDMSALIKVEQSYSSFSVNRTTFKIHLIQVLLPLKFFYHRESKFTRLVH